MNTITLNATELMEQSSDTIQTYLYRVTKCIDVLYGDGYAKLNPTLVGQLTVACAVDFHSSMFICALQDLQSGLLSISTALKLNAQATNNADAINNIASQMESLVDELKSQNVNLLAKSI